MSYESKLLKVSQIQYCFSNLDAPIAALNLGSSLNASNIKEGDDVYFECNVRANPKPYKITWKFNVSCFLYITLDYREFSISSHYTFIYDMKIKLYSF